MQTVYLNMRTNYGVETVDQLSTSEFNSYKEFRKELKRLLSEYSCAGMQVYSSQRCDKSWNNK